MASPYSWLCNAHAFPFKCGELPSVLSTYSTNASIVQTFKPHFFPNARHPAVLSIPESTLSALGATGPWPFICTDGSPSSTSSHITPTSPIRASLQNSTAASVCPFLDLIPPSLALRGNTCPGLRKLADRALRSARVRHVRALSCDEIPVVVLGSDESIDTVYAVPWTSVEADGSTM